VKKRTKATNMSYFIMYLLLPAISGTAGAQRAEFDPVAALSANVCSCRSNLVFFDEADGVADGQDRACGGIWNFHTEFFFDFHDDLNDFEGIGTEIVSKIGVVDNGAGIDAQLVNDDFFDTVCDGGHGGTPRKLFAAE
jgi:hypothetical protein